MLSYADKPLILLDPQHKYERWLDRCLALEDVRLFGSEPVAIREGRWIPRRYTGFTRVGLPTPNYSRPPRPKFNTLWWPTGASRWAVGLFLIDFETAKYIANEVSDSAVLKAREELGCKGPWRGLSCDMWPLALRPMNYADQAGSGWALVLVDQRYWWQFKDAGELYVSCSTTWSDLLTTIGGRLGVSIDADAIPAAYLGPDPTELSRTYENAAVLLDAIAACVGQRVVVDLAGKVYSMSATRSYEVLQGNWDGWPRGRAKTVDVTGAVDELGYWKLAGGGLKPNYNNFAPENLRVVFGRYVNGQPVESGLVWIEESSAAAHGIYNSLAGTVKTFYDTMQADFTSGGPYPDNQADLVALTAAIAADYYDWQKGHLAVSDEFRDRESRAYDLTCHGIRFWHPTGYDDYAWWHFAYQQPQQAGPADPFSGFAGDGDYMPFTRIASHPYNFGISELLHWECYDESSESVSESESLSESSSLSQSSSQSQSSEAGVTIDVLVCNPWNRCGQNIVFPQKRLHLPPGTIIEDIAATVVPLTECQSSGDESQASFVPMASAPPEAPPPTVTWVERNGAWAPASPIPPNLCSDPPLYSPKSGESVIVPAFDVSEFR